MNASTLIIREIRTRYGFAVSAIVAQLAKPPHPMLLDDICAEVARRTDSTPMRPVISHLRKGDEDPPDPANTTQKLAVVQTLDQLVDEREIETGHASLEQLGSYSNRLLRLVRELDDTDDAADLAAVLLRHRSSWGELLARPRPQDQTQPDADRGAGADVDTDVIQAGARDRDAEVDWVPASMLAGIHLNPPEASHTYGEEFEGSPGEDAVWLLNAASMLENPTAIIAARQIGRLARMETGLRLDVRHAVDRILRRGGTVHHVLPPDNGTAPDADLRADAVCWLLSDIHNQGDYQIVRLPAPSPNVVAVKDFGAVELISDVPGPGDDDADSQAIDATELSLEVSFAGQWEKGQWGSARAPGSDRPSAAQTHGSAPDALVVKGTARSKQLFRSVAAVAELSHRPVERMTVDIHTPSEKLTAFDRSLSAVELTPGPRILVRRGLATTHIPPDVTDRQFASWSKNCGQDGAGDVIDELWGLRHARRNALLYNCRRNTYWDITEISAIEEYLSGTGEDGNALYGGRFLTRNDRRAHVETVRDMLLYEALDYRLALVDQTQLPLLADDRTWWVLTSSPNGSANQVHIVHDPADATSRTVLASLAAGVRDPFDIAGSLTRMFEQHIAEWEDTSPECVDPKLVADRLTELLGAR